MADKISPKEYQELGRRYYKLKQYEKAIEVLSRGIDSVPTIGLYDLRAAVFDKLNEFNAAVKDGREMIKLNRQEVKGYLRTASILEKMDKPDTALGIYSYGMKNVPVEDANFKLLQQLHDRLTRQLSPATAVDPFSVMPVELVDMVLQYVSFRDMIKYTRVSRGWRDSLCGMPKLWMHLDLSGARRLVPRSFVAAAVKRARGRLARLTIHRFEHADMLMRMGTACKNLSEIEIISLPYHMSATLVEIAKSAILLKKFVIHAVISADTAQLIMRHGPQLQHVAFNHTTWDGRLATWSGTFENLKFFSMHSKDLMYPQVSDLLRKSPALEHLSLTNVFELQMELDTTPLPPLTTLILRKTTLQPFPRLPLTLRCLVIDVDAPLYTPDFLPMRLPHLLDLTLSGLNHLSGEVLHHLLDVYTDDDKPAVLHTLDHTTATPLHSISLRGTLSSQGLQSLFPNPFTALLANPSTSSSTQPCTDLLTRSPRILTHALTNLDIATLPCTDDEIEALLAHPTATLTGIETINISDTCITGATIKMLADGLPRLRTIKADRCSRITGRDAVAYAERRGIAVSCLMDSVGGNAGRRVRYG